eukprot:4161010-Alexandrium_andersonii.AAC.1
MRRALEQLHARSVHDAFFLGTSECVVGHAVVPSSAGLSEAACFALPAPLVPAPACSPPLRGSCDARH